MRTHKISVFFLVALVSLLFGGNIYSQRALGVGGTLTADSTAIITNRNRKVQEAVNNKVVSSSTSAITLSTRSAISTVITKSVVIPTSFNYYVATNGSNTNPGTEAEPFATIQKAIDVSVTGNAIKVMTGTYIENIDFKGKSIKIVGSPEDPELTIIDGGGVTHCVQMIAAVNSSTLLSGFTLTNGNATATTNYHTSKGGAIYLFDNANPTLAQLIITGNTAQFGGGIAALHSASPTLESVLIYNNTSTSAGGAAYFYNGVSPVLNNVTIAGNTTNNTTHGAFYLSRAAIVNMQNCIMWNEESVYEISFNSSTSNNSSCVIIYNYSDKRGGQTGYVNLGTSGYTMTVTWGTGSISTSPAFVSYSGDDYHLLSTSPCIDGGDPATTYNDVNFPPSQGTARNDMGVYGGPSVWLTESLPTNENVSLLINNSVTVSWDDTWANETAIEIERSTDNVNFSQIGIVNANTNQYIDINLRPDVTYYYRVRAIVNGVGSDYVNGSITIDSYPAYETSTTTKNYAISNSYGENGNITGQAIAFVDNLARSTQTISRSISDNRIIAGQTYYDNYGRPVLSALAVPVAQTNLNYIASFATKSGTTTDLESLSLTEISIIDLAISAASPLGSYYSASGFEGFVPEDDYPYTVVQYSKTQPGVVRKTTLAGKDHRLGQNHEIQAYSMPVSGKELVLFGNIISPYFIDDGIELRGLVKSIAIDADGKEAITYSASDDKLVSSCISNSPNASDLRTYSYEFDAALSNFYYDFHLPKGCANTLRVTSSNGSSYKYSVVNLATDNNVLTDISLGNTSFQSIVPGVYRLVFQRPATGSYTVTLEYKLNYYNYSLNVYDKVGRLTKSYSPKAVATKTPTMVTTYEYNSLGQLLATTSPDEGRTEYKYRTDGLIRFSQNALQRANETAVNGNGYFSYTNYDATGRVISVGEYKSGSNRFSLLASSETLSGTMSFVTVTKYDTKAVSLPVTGYTQNYTLGRVSKTSNDNCTTWYSYTYDGNIEWVIQQYTGFETKTMDYEYDFNGNVVRAIYQKNTYAERFDHEYIYDADGRLSLVLTKDYIAEGSTGKVNKQRQQAKYIYYAHGPLKRIELADKLQGIDCVYNINGMLKSINNPTMVIAEDPGADGPASNQFGQDVFAMTLDYYYNDYYRTGKTIKSSAPSGTNSYSGLIYAQRWNTNQIDKTGTAPGSVQSMYKYDYTNENWLGKATFGTFSGTTFSSGDLYKVYGLNGSTEINIPYDANGNILNMVQNGSTTTNLNMDKLAYNYITGKNQLGYVTDAITSDIYADDLTTQPSGNYTYDVIGRMTGNMQDLQYFDYDVYGHVTKIYKNLAKTQILSEYTYDDKGFRIKKIDRLNTPATVTWYVRDASGNILAIYSAPEGSAATRTEVEVYGASRLGTAQVVSGAISKYLYELTDHLGNVRAVVAADGTDANTYPDLAAYTDFYPMGMSMSDRLWTSGLLSGAYRFGYQGQYAEKDPETGYNQFEARLYDSRIGRWMIPDPAGQYWSPYLGMGNNWVSGVDPDGCYKGWFNDWLFHHDVWRYKKDCIRADDIALNQPLTFIGRTFLDEDLGIWEFAIVGDAPWSEGESRIKYAIGHIYNPEAGPILNNGPLETVHPEFWIALGFLSPAANAAKTGTVLATKYPANAAITGTTERTFLMPGQVIDRYGPLSGKWFSTPGTSYGARSIPSGLSPYTQFRVLKPFEIQKSLASPGFFSGQTGFGIQFQSPVGADILIKRGIITPF